MEGFQKSKLGDAATWLNLVHMDQPSFCPGPPSTHVGGEVDGGRGQPSGSTSAQAAGAQKR